MKKITGLVLINLFSALAIASGTMTLNGKLRNFNSTSIDVEDTKKIYSLNRKKLGDMQSKLVAETKSGEKIQLLVPFDAIENIKIIKK